MKAKQSFGQLNAQRLGLAVLFGCILVPVIILALVKSNSHQFAIWSLQLSIRTYGPLSTMDEEGGAKHTGVNLTSLQERNDSTIGVNNEPIILSLPFNVKPNGDNSSTAAIEVTKVPFDLDGKQNENTSIIDNEMTKQHLDVKEEPGRNKTVIEVTKVSNDQKPEQNYTTGSFNSGDESGIRTEKTEQAPNLNEKQAGNKSVVIRTENVKQDENRRTEDNKQVLTIISDEQPDKNHTVEGNNALQESSLVCDLSGIRSDTCSLLGDIRVLSKSTTIILASPSQSLPTSGNSTFKIRPYARKWESPVMQQIKEVTVSPSSDSEHTPSCSVKHAVPAVIFSTGGFLGNLFHDFTDVLVPLFATSRQFQGEVQFLVTDFNSKWINKYQPILKQLSRYGIINMDTEDQVHCFVKAQVGLLSHKVLGIDPSKTPRGYSMLDFKQFLRSSFSLNKESANVIPRKSRKKPRLLMILRKGSRSLINTKEVVSMARSMGFKVITAGPEDTKDLARFARIVNTCDVMMGVHGAGLANMVFLPTNASLIQVIPWGGLKWACWHDFGEPAPDMGLNYVEYEIKEEESSLIEEYPRDHAVFKDPLAIHRQGWNQLWSIFLDKQKVKLDVGRFRGVLLEIFQSLKK